MARESAKARGAKAAVLPFSKNDRVDHFKFGTGTILEVDERRTTIAFDESGTRKFVTSLVKLTPSDTPAPVKKTRARKKKKT